MYIGVGEYCFLSSPKIATLDSPMKDIFSTIPMCSRLQIISPLGFTLVISNHEPTSISSFQGNICFIE